MVTEYPNKLLSHTLLATALCVGALTATVQAQEEAPGDSTIATINGTAYSLDLFRMFYARRLQETNAQNSPEFQERAFNEFLNLVVAAQAGEARKLGDDAEVQLALELQRMNVLSTAELQAVAREAEITEDELKQAYETLKESAKRTEYKARHILMDDQTKAQEVADMVTDAEAKNFEELAKEHSLGPTADKGGDLGWFDTSTMVKPFGDAIAQLQPGEWTKQPIQTQFGWHVILLEESRDAAPPSFEEAKPGLENLVRRQKVAQALNKLRSDAAVELNEEVVRVKEEGDG
jgi:peptidyl-prolyl cis-trans isomerase C